MSLDRLILGLVSCVVCGTQGVGRCNCWSKCQDCGWSYRTGEHCRNCAGENAMEAIAMTKPKRRRSKSERKRT